MQKNRDVLILCLLGLTVALAGCCVNIGNCRTRAKYEKTIELNAPLEPGSTVAAKTSFGSITVMGADVSDCKVVARVCVQAPTEQEAIEIAEKVKISLEPNGETLTIKAHKPHFKNNRCISISYELTVPAQTSIECDSSYGSVKLSDLTGTMDAHTNYGSINCANINGPLRLNTSYGSINCTDIISDQLKANSSYGSLNIEYSQEASAEILADVSTSYGSVNFAAPPGFAGQVELATSHGSIKTDLPITVKGKISNKRIKGTIGNGQGELRIKTSFGSIKIR